jgi:Tfp pilus assembly PilM family ATPase
MPNRTGFDLHPEQCRVVDVHVPASRSARPADVRVNSFALLAEGRMSPTLSEDLRRLRQEQRLAREAWVTIWGLRSIHQFLRLPPAANTHLEALSLREARRELSALEGEAGRVSVALMIGADVQVGSHRRREVSLTAVPESEITRQLQPLTDAGFDVRGVCTPAMALAAVARRHGRSTPGTTAAYVALESNATCVTIIRDGVLLFSREIPWGFSGALTPDDSNEPVDERLAAEVRRSMLFFRQSFRTAVDRVVLCGGVTNVRALTSSLGSALSLPVETLDSLSGIDAEAVPEPADAFRSVVAALWPAIAVAAETGERANLLPAAIRMRREKRAELTRIAAGFLAGVATVAAWYFITGSTRQARASEVARIEERVATLQPQADRIAAQRRNAETAALQDAALIAFEAQGPRLARLLEALSQSIPPEVVLSEIDAQAEGAHWRTVVTGTAITDDAAGGQNAVKGLLQRLAESPYVGPTAQTSSFRIISGDDGAPSRATEESAAPRSIPQGMSGVEFSARFNVRK